MKTQQKKPEKDLKIPYGAIKIDENGGYIKESAIVEVPNMSASQLYKKILEWEKKYDFNAGKANIKKYHEPFPYHLDLVDKLNIENKKAVIFGWIIKGSHISGSFYDLLFRLEILFKEGKYNFKISPKYFKEFKHETKMSPEEMSVFLQRSILPNEFDYFYNKINNFHLSLFNYLTDGAVSKDIEKDEDKW